MKNSIPLNLALTALLLGACTGTPTTARIPMDTPVPTAAPATIAPADTPAPAPTDTPVPATATTASANVALVMESGEHAVGLTITDLLPALSDKTAFNGFLSKGGSAGGTAYALSSPGTVTSIAINADGQSPLGFISHANYGLAVWPGDGAAQTRLAWGTSPTGPSDPSTIQMANADGTGMQVLFTDDSGPDLPTQLVAEFWSADGRAVYFSKEPYGIGGYILFAGASNLYRVDVDSKAVTEIIARGASYSPMLCLDAITDDLRLVADHCTSGTITVRDLQQGTSTSITPPAIPGETPVAGSARFNAAGTRVAYALARSDPDNEQFWLAISDGLSGASHVFFTAPPGLTYTIHGWLDDDTLLIESDDIQCNPACQSAVWSIRTDGSALTRIADGNLLTIIR